jgi:hypothetical protein
MYNYKYYNNYKIIKIYYNNYYVITIIFIIIMLCVLHVIISQNFTTTLLKLHRFLL